jgi:3-deoxy-manno-octulosonate cytidylyltransferase (CMP-KDO synthetase)
MNIVGIIPARMGSSRFPGKPLARLRGMPMIGHVYFRSGLNARLSGLYIATCDDEIRRYAETIGADCIMTSSSHLRASDRTAEAIDRIEALQPNVDVVVMIQGDEPMIHPKMIDEAVEPLDRSPSAQIVNLMAPLGPEDACDPNEVKVVVNRLDDALYFSRHPLPWRRDPADTTPPLFKQVCVITFRRPFLRLFASLEPTPLESVESIDMLRALEHGYPVRMARTAFATCSVDTPADLARVEALMEDDPLISCYGGS